MFCYAHFLFAEFCKLRHQIKCFVTGLIDTAASTVERGFLKAFEEDITIGEWFAYTFDPGTIALDFASGVLIDCLIDEAADLFKGRKPARLVDGVTEQVSDAVGDSVTRETREAIEDAVGDSVSRETREAVEDAVGDSVSRETREAVEDAVGDSVGRETKEAVEDAVGDTTGEILDDFDEYEQFYEDLFEQQRETCREYEDFLDDLRELQREGMGEGLDIPLPDSSMTPGMKDAVGDAVAEGGGNVADDLTEAARKTQKSLIESVENSAEGTKGLTNLQKGNYGEMKMDNFFESQGYDRISADRVTDLNEPSHQGIDGVYYNPDGHPPYIIGEAKYGSSKLGSTLDGKQMSDNWIDKRLVDAVGEEMADDIITEMMLKSDNVQKQLINILTDGNIKTKILDEYANVVK